MISLPAEFSAFHVSDVAIAPRSHFLGMVLSLFVEDIIFPDTEICGPTD